MKLKIVIHKTKIHIECNFFSTWIYFPHTKHLVKWVLLVFIDQISTVDSINTGPNLSSPHIAAKVVWTHTHTHTAATAYLPSHTPDTASQRTHNLLFGWC